MLNYFGKYHSHLALDTASKEMLQNIEKTKKTKSIDILLGLEGASASAYFQALREANLFSSTFKGREGRGSQEINNSLLNLGYAILSSYILNALINAGLEPYLGVFA